MPASLRQRLAWSALAAHHGKIAPLHLRELFAKDLGRGERLNVEAAGIFLDFSKNCVTDETMALLAQLAAESGLRERIDFAEATWNLDPADTLFVVSSKTFTTLETMTHARTARDWVLASLGGDARAVAKVLAQRIIPALTSSGEPALAHDGSTNALIRRYRRMRQPGR